MDNRGTVMAQAQAPLTVSRPQPLWSEQAPESWWNATNAAVAMLPPELRKTVQCIGLSGQMHGAVFLSADDRPIRPAILWNDGRSHAECQILESRVAQSREITGNQAMAGFTAPKALWLKEHEPHNFESVQKVLLPKDYVRLRMSGDYATDVSDASGTLWLDVSRRAWSSDMLAGSDLSIDAMPSVFEGPEITGRLLKGIANDWGMSTVPVIAGGGDNAAGAVGVGIINNGDAFLSLGTSGVLFAPGTSFKPNPEHGIHAFCHALPQRWHEMTVMLSAASCLDWAARLIGATDVASFLALAEKSKINQPVIFLPYLSGERTPHNDPRARGVFFGMDHDTGPEDIAHAVLEGVAFGLADGFNVFKDDNAIDTITVIGGGSRSSYWGKILAAALNKPLVYRKNADVGPALGAARLAQLSIEGGNAADICAPPEILTTVEPCTAYRDAILPKMNSFKKLYTDLNSRFQQTGNS